MNVYTGEIKLFLKECYYIKCTVVVSRLPGLDFASDFVCQQHCQLQLFFSTLVSAASYARWDSATC